MFPRTGLVFALGLLAATALAAQPDAEAAIEAAEPLRMATTVFGASAEIEVRDLPAAEARAAIEAALTEIFAVSRLADPDGVEPGGVGMLNLAAGEPPRPVDGRTAELLLRGLQFCIWSTGAYGPLGGEIYRAWGRGRPSAADLALAVDSSDCGRLALRNDEATGGTALAALAAGSRIDLRGIARGFAVDRAAEILAARGAHNVWIQIDNVLRARGGGPEGRGWLAALPPIPGETEPLAELWLRDHAVAFVTIDPAAGASADGIVDFRNGVPARGVVTVVAVSERAVDVEPLVHALFILGHRDGHMRLGTLQPRPSVYWLLGRGDSPPLEATYHWSVLERARWRR